MKFLGVVRSFRTTTDKLERFRSGVVQNDVTQEGDEMAQPVTARLRYTPYLLSVLQFP